MKKAKGNTHGGQAPAGRSPQQPPIRRTCPKALREPLQRFRDMAEALDEVGEALREMGQREQALVTRGQAYGLRVAADIYLDWADDQRIKMKCV